MNESYMNESLLGYSKETVRIVMRTKQERDALLSALYALMSHWGPYDPGHSDLDDEQPEAIHTTLGELRKIDMLLQRIKYHEKE